MGGSIFLLSLLGECNVEFKIRNIGARILKMHHPAWWSGLSLRGSQGEGSLNFNRLGGKDVGWKNYIC